MTNLLTLRTIEADLDHPECVTWGPDGRVYAGGEAGQVYRFDLADDSCEEFAGTGGFVLGLALDADANVYACDLKRHEIVRVTPDGTVATYATGPQERPIRLPNFPVFDEQGSLYVSDSGTWGERDGLIWRVPPGGGTAEVWDERCSGFTNGMCLTADGDALIVVESSPPQVSRVEIAADGSAGERTLLVELPRTVPDGVAFDVEGNLFISCFNPNHIYRLDPAGELTVMYDDWEQLQLKAPTNVAFGGPDLKTLVIAGVAWRDLNTAPMDVAGLPLRYPRVEAR